MLDLHIVTDSCAHFENVRSLSQYPITILPNKITINGKTYRDGIDVGSDELMSMIRSLATPPVITSPSEEEFSQVYTKLQRENKTIISIHPSRELFASWQNARRAVQPLQTSGEIAVIDSQNISNGQGILVLHALKLAQLTSDFESLVRHLRGMIERIYSIYCVENTEFLLHNSILSTSHSILSAMINIKPFVTIENGDLVTIEKVKTRSQIIDRFIEFASEFEEIEESRIVQPRPNPISDISRLIQNRLEDEFPNNEFPATSYSPALAALIGANAHGLVIMEQEMSIKNES